MDSEQPIDVETVPVPPIEKIHEAYPWTVNIPEEQLKGDDYALRAFQYALEQITNSPEKIADAQIKFESMQGYGFAGIESIHFNRVIRGIQDLQDFQKKHPDVLLTDLCYHIVREANLRDDLSAEHFRPASAFPVEDRRNSLTMAESLGTINPNLAKFYHESGHEDYVFMQALSGGEFCADANRYGGENNGIAFLSTKQSLERTGHAQVAGTHRRISLGASQYKEMDLEGEIRLKGNVPISQTTVIALVDREQIQDKTILEQIDQMNIETYSYDMAHTLHYLMFRAGFMMGKLSESHYRSTILPKGNFEFDGITPDEKDDYRHHFLHDTKLEPITT